MTLLLVLLILITALSLSHEDAPLNEIMPYLQYRFQPLPVLSCIGRAAGRSPPCDPSHAVFHWWKECHQCVSTVMLV